MEILGQDAGYGLRMLRKAAFSATNLELSSWERAFETDLDSARGIGGWQEFRRGDQ
jgi:hypothetical protein